MYYDPMECGMRISKLRMECGKTQQQMADKLNISLDHYRALENGRRGGSLDLLIELAITFDISLDYLILGRVKYSDTERIQRELENIMGQIGQLKASLYSTVTNSTSTVTTSHSGNNLDSATI